MAAALLRRTAATALTAALATIASPMVVNASAAATSLAAPTFTPADGATVTATRPAISAVYNTALSSSSTIGVTDTKDNSTVPCTGSLSADAKTISCALGAGLTDGDKYQVAVHAVNAADSTNTRDDSASWTVDIPSVTSTSPVDGQVLGSSQPLKAVFDEQIDTSHSTAKLTNGFGNTVPGSVSVTNPSPTGQPTVKNGTITFTSSQPLPANTYTVTFHADGVTANGIGTSDNPAAYADVVIHFTVDKVMPPAAPVITSHDPNINANNVKAVHFSGLAAPGFPLTVAIYDEDCDTNCAAPLGGHEREGFGDQDAHTTVIVGSCDSPQTVNGVAMCPWNLTVDDSAGCDTGTPEFNCPVGDASKNAAKNQYYAFSSSSAGQLPSSASPAKDPEIVRDTTPPAAPDSAQGHVTGNTLTVSGFTSDFDSEHVVVEAIDPVGGKVSHTLNLTADPTGQVLQYSGSFDISSLADGTITANVMGVDAVGNVGDPTTAQPDSLSASFKKSTVQLATANPVTPDTIVYNGQAVSFDDIQSANTHVGLPSQVTVYFNEPIQLKVTQTSGTPPTTTDLYVSEICLRESDGICVNRGNGSYKIVGGGYALQWTPDYSTLSLSDAGSPYTITAFGVSAECVNETPTNSSGYTCERNSTNHDTGDAALALAQFTLDTTPPTASILSVTSPINKSNISTAAISGWSSTDTSTVQVLIKSGANGTRQFASTTPYTDGCTNPNGSCWTLPLRGALVGVPDGKLSLSATASDLADNKSDPANATAVLDMLHLRITAGDGQLGLTWVNPGVGGAGNPITGYTLTVIDTTANKPVASKELLPTATSTTLKNLVNGHAYGINLLAHDDSGNGPTAIATVTPRAATKLTETTSAKTVTYGQAIKLSGRLTKASDGSGVTGQKLTITPKFDNGHFGPATTVKTTTFGEWSKKLSPAQNATYYVTFAGTKALAPASVHSARTLVRTRLSWTAPANPGAVGSPVTLKGKVSPNKAGHRVGIYRHTSSGDQLIGYATLTSTSTWAFKLKIPVGTTTVVAKIGKTAGNLGNHSTYLRLTH